MVTRLAACQVGIQPERGVPADDVGAVHRPARREHGDAGHQRRRRDRLSGQDHRVTGPARRSGTPLLPRGLNALALTATAVAVTARIPTARPTRRTLQRWIGIGSRGGARARNVPSRSRGSLLHGHAQLGRARHPAGGGERLGEFGRGEVVQRPLVHPVWASDADREHQHHVAQVDRLPPRRGPDLNEHDVDQQQFPRRTMRLPGLMSRCAIPASQSFRTSSRPWSITCVVDVGVTRSRPRRRRTR